TPTSERYNPPESDEEAAPDPETNGSERSLPRDATILVIDDDEKVRIFLKHLLESEGYRVIMARDGHEGLKMADEHHPDAITLDVVMPGGKDGWQVLHDLKASSETQSIPVVMVSVMAERENGLTLDVEDYLVKPIDVERLRRVILRATGQSPQRNLLLVDDDSDSLEAMRRILEEAGWQTLLAHDGAEALEILEKTRPAAIVLDLIMPGMDGFEFLERLEENAPSRSIPVIVLTGKSPSEEETEFLRDRAEAVITKGGHSATDLITAIDARLRARDRVLSDLPS
ncbi:MAG: response regulator, partial [Verrucomicrobiota bacterium]